MNRRAVILCAVLWQGGCSALLALGAWARAIDPSSVLICIFATAVPATLLLDEQVGSPPINALLAKVRDVRKQGQASLLLVHE
ncbi:MAG: hypothetical protein WCC08_03390 [Terrimicrobiaceae bacterium]